MEGEKPDIRVAKSDIFREFHKKFEFLIKMPLSFPKTAGAKQVCKSDIWGGKIGHLLISGCKTCKMWSKCPFYNTDWCPIFPTCVSVEFMYDETNKKLERRPAP